MRLTKEHIEGLRTPKGGFKKDSLGVIGIPWPLTPGWKIKAAGREIDEAVYRLAVKLSGGPMTRRQTWTTKHITAPKSGSYRSLIVPRDWGETDVRSLAVTTGQEPSRVAYAGDLGDYSVWQAYS